MKKTSGSNPRSLVLLMVLICQLTVSFTVSRAQEMNGKVLVVEAKGNPKKQVRFQVGQTASFKTSTSKDYQKGVIHEITDSTISFTDKQLGTVRVPFNDLKELKALKPGRGGGGTALIITGLAATVLGLGVIQLLEGHAGSGDAGAAVLLPIGGVILIITGAVLLHPDEANMSTLKKQANTSPLKVQTRQEVANEKQQTLKADTIEYYKKFKVGVFAGHAWAAGAKGAVLALEPAFRLNDDISLGLRIEHAFLNLASQPAYPSGTIPGSPGTTSVTASFQYYLGSGPTRGFIGFGLGPCFYSTPSTARIGFYPRIGFDANHFTMSMEYNVLQNVSGTADTYLYNQNFNYLAAKLGIVIGGGRK